MLIFLFISQILAFEIDGNGHFIKNGTIHIFHGVNVIFTKPPFYPKIDEFNIEYSFSEQDCKILNDYGFNVIRLNVAFEGGMKTKGIVDDQYIIKIREIVQLAARYNIQVILVAHQELLSQKFCGHGFPDWAIISTNFPSPFSKSMQIDQFGNPIESNCQKYGTSDYYYTHDVGNNMERLFKNQDNLADYFGQFWKRVAELHLNESNILGYDILNNPTSGNYGKSKIDFLWPGYGNRELLLPFYKQITNYIRKVDNKTLIFFQPFTLDYFGGGFPTKIRENKKEVLSYHIYCGFTQISTNFCKFGQDLQIKLKIYNSNYLNTGSFMTEFGQLPNEEYSYEILNSLLMQADIYQQSWTYWQYKGEKEGLFEKEGQNQKYKINALIRPYAQQICAKQLLISQYDSIQQIYRLKFLPNIDCETILYIPFEFSNECFHCKLNKLKNKQYALKSLSYKDYNELIVVSQ